MKSLLRADGVSRAGYAERFGSTVDDDFPQLLELAGSGHLDFDAVRLTAEGLAYSDAIGPWLVSPGVRAAMAGYTAR